ncbi:MAG: hypothetical protein JO326_04350 [Acetobacteraceae bacterium]|nr:hypothetical protein [Acetobacteraceae bacterium]
MTTQTLPFVAMLPLKIAGAHYDENLDRLRLLLDSFERFLDLPAPLAVTAVCVPDEIARACAAFDGCRSVALDFVSEETLVPGIGAHRAIGWYKQQALKLAFTAQAQAPFVLALDPDILLCRTLRADDLVRDGRCYTSWMTKAEHPHWWAASSALLGMTPDPARAGLNVTPNMLAADIGCALGRYLAQRLGADNPWLALLDQDVRWTEYTLYSVYAECAGLLDARHRGDLPQGRRLLGRSVWTRENFENYSLAAIHEAADGAFFTVCASHTFVPTATLRGMWQELIDRIAA